MAGKSSTMKKTSNSKMKYPLKANERHWEQVHGEDIKEKYAEDATRRKRRQNQDVRTTLREVFQQTERMKKLREKHGR